MPFMTRHWPSAFSYSGVCLGLLIGIGTMPMWVTTVEARERTYNVPAGDLGVALTRFANQAGVSLSVNPRLVDGLRTSGLSGNHSIEEGFQQILQGSGLELQPVDDAGYTLVSSHDRSAIQSLEMAPTLVIENKAALLNDDGERYAGGQVARRGSQGLLGSRDFMDTPFSMTTYTSETVRRQQARTLNDLVANDPAVRTTNAAGGRFEQFTIRGFTLFNSDVSYNGLYGVLPTYSIDMEMADRVDILKGPSQLINGISPRGSIGGGINIVPKRATDKPINVFTGSYISNNQIGGSLDIGRRFGESNQFGIRFNGVQQSGDTEWDQQSIDRKMAVLGLDYRTSRLRLSLDAGRTERDTDAPQERVQIGANAKIPNADDVRDNYAQSWSKARTNDSFGAFRAEFDVSNALTLYGAFGLRESNHDFLRHNVSITNDAGDFTVQPRDFTRDESVRTATAGARYWIHTGPISHEFNLGATYYYMDYQNGGARYATGLSNLYDPIDTPVPTQLTRFDSKVYTENRFTSIALSDTLGFLKDRVLLTLGGRWQRIKVDDWTDGVKGETGYNETQFSPSAGIVFKVSDQLSLYTSYIQGLSQGKIAPSTSLNEDEIFSPFTSRQIEIGAKLDLGNFALTASAFRIKQPAYETNSTTQIFGPNGTRENRGIELGLFGEPLAGFRLLGGGMYINSKLTGTRDGTYDGNRAPATPKLNVNLGSEWDIPWVPGLTLTGRGIYTSSQYLDQANSKKIESWERFDVGGRYTFKLHGKSFTVLANIENVLDKRYWASSGASDDSAPGLTLSTPRSFLLSVSVEL